ncbi:unnamed protein product [Caenorhabditis nigoni]
MVLEDEEASGQTCVVFYASSLFYFNCERFEKKIQKIVDQKFRIESKPVEGEDIPMIPEKVHEKTVIFDMRGVSNIDLSGANTLLKICQELKTKNVVFKIRDPNDSVSSFLHGVPNTDHLFE